MVISLDIDVEKEVEFRNQMLGNLVPLLEHKDMTVCEAAFAALLLFPMEDVQQYIPPPSVLLSKGIYSDFLLQKIQLECRNMSRPVFKALSVEEGGKRTKEAEKDYHLKLSAMETQILSKTQNKQFIHALLFCIHSQDWKKDFLAFNEMVIQDVQFGEGLEGYTLFWTRVLKTQEPQKVIQEGFEMIVQKLTKAKTPSSTINFVLGGTGLALASLSLNVSTKWVHDWIETCRSKLDDKISRDIEGSLLLSLVRMIRFKKTFDVELATFVWNRCVGDGYLNAMCGARLLSIVANTERGLQWIKDYLERFYDGKWKTVGAAIGFSVLVKENPVYRDYVIEKVPEMIEDAYNLMAAAKRNLNDEIACCWILSCLDPLSHDLFASRLKMAVQNREEDLLPHLFKAYIRTASQGKYVEIQELLKVCVEYCESPHVAIKFAAVAGMQLLLGNDESFSISMPIVNSSDSLDLVQLGIKMLGETDQSRFGRALGFFVGNGIQRIQNRVSGLTGVVNGGDPMDYKRLNPEQSYLRACFDLLKNPRDEMEYLILKNIFFNVDCVLAPVDWSFLLETRTRDQVLEYFQFVIKQVDSKSAKCFIGFFLELINEVMTIYVQSRIDEYETVLFQGLEKLFDMVGLNGGSLIPVQQCWNVLESLIDSCLEIRWNDFGIRFTMKMKQSLQRADESDIKHTLCIKVIEYIEQLSEKVESNAIGLCIKNLAGSLATSPAEQDHFIHQMKDTERDLWAYGALLESRPELVHNFLLRYYQLIKLESKSAVYCLWYVFRTDNNSLKWFVDILDLMILKLNPEKIHFSKFLWNVGVSCLYGGEPLYECDWKCMNFNTILKLKKEVKQKSKLNQAIISRLTKLEQHFQHNQIAREFRYLLGQ
jgi:hypothetical protein